MRRQWRSQNFNFWDYGRANWPNVGAGFFSPPEFPLGGLSEFFSCRVAAKHGCTLSKGRPAMLARSSVQFGASRSYGGSRPFASGLIASLAALAFISSLVKFDSTARSMVDPSAQTVNRALKGDRLPLAPVSRPDAENQPAELRAPRTSTPDSRLPDGCEAVVSSIANSELAHIAGRCVS